MDLRRHFCSVSHINQGPRHIIDRSDFCGPGSGLSNPKKRKKFLKRFDYTFICTTCIWFVQFICLFWIKIRLALEYIAVNWDQHFSFPWSGFMGTASVLFGKFVENDITPAIVKSANLLFSFSAIYFLIKIFSNIPLSISIYSWLMLFLILGKVDNNSAMVSTTRYLVTLFPVFMSQALFIKRKYQRIMVFSVSIALQIIFLVYFYWWVWVA